MFGGHKAAIFTQVGQFYFGRWVSFSSAVTNRHTGFEDVAQVNRSLKCLMDLQTPGQGSAVPLEARLSA